MFPDTGSIAAYRPPGMLSICVDGLRLALTFKYLVHGDGGVVIAAEPWWEEILYFEEI